MYIFSIKSLEEYLQKQRTKTLLNNIVIQDYEALYSSRHDIREKTNTNIERHLEIDRLRPLGVIAKILVTTKKGQFLYPFYYEEGSINSDRGREFESISAESFNYVKVAERNFQILNDGIRL